MLLPAGRGRAAIQASYPKQLGTTQTLWSNFGLDGGTRRIYDGSFPQYSDVVAASWAGGIFALPVPGYNLEFFLQAYMEHNGHKCALWIGSTEIVPLIESGDTGSGNVVNSGFVTVSQALSGALTIKDGDPGAPAGGAHIAQVTVQYRYTRP